MMLQVRSYLQTKFRQTSIANTYNYYTVDIPLLMAFLWALSSSLPSVSVWGEPVEQVDHCRSVALQAKLDDYLASEASQ